MDAGAIALAGVVIAVAGTWMAGLADRLADRTGLGEALVGAVFLGASTSLSGITATTTAAADGFPALAVSNALGGIAVQTLFLAIADVCYRRANLEHAAASVSNLIQSVALMALLSIVLMAITGPAWTIGHLHVATPVLIVVYLFGLRLAYRSGSTPMWRPQVTVETVEDRAAAGAEREGLAGLWIGFALAAALVVAAGVVVARAGSRIVAETGLSESLVGGVFTATVTSLPELVTTIAAVRRGALTLAVSDIVGGNAFDVLFLCVADAAYLPGAIYRAVTEREIFLVALALVLNVTVLAGLIQRDRHGPGGIGFESVGVFVIYVGGMLMLAAM